MVNTKALFRGARKLTFRAEQIVQGGETDVKERDGEKSRFSAVILYILGVFFFFFFFIFRVGSRYPMMRSLVKKNEYIKKEYININVYIFILRIYIYS